jgi:hypothetical protein
VSASQADSEVHRLLLPKFPQLATPRKSYRRLMLFAQFERVSGNDAVAQGCAIRKAGTERNLMLANLLSGHGHKYVDGREIHLSSPAIFVTRRKLEVSARQSLSIVAVLRNPQACSPPNS